MWLKILSRTFLSFLPPPVVEIICGGQAGLNFPDPEEEMQPCEGKRPADFTQWFCSAQHQSRV